MSRERRLALLLAAFVVAIAYLVWTRGFDLLRSGSAAGPGGAARSRTVLGAELVELRTDDLRQKTGEYRPGRDLFRYGQPEAAAPPPRRRRRKPPPARQEVTVPTPQPESPPKPQPPPIDVVYLGSFGRAGVKIAVFADEEAIYNATIGDVVKDVFVLKNIGYESADLGFVGFPDVEAERLAVGGSLEEFLR